MAYWYQSEPHAAFPTLPDRAGLHPPVPPVYAEAREAFLGAAGDAVRTFAADAIHRLAPIGESFYAGRFDETLRRLREA